MDEFQRTNPKAYWWYVGDQDANAGLNNRVNQAPEQYRSHYKEGYRQRTETIAHQRQLRNCFKEQGALF